MDFKSTIIRAFQKFESFIINSKLITIAYIHIYIIHISNIFLYKIIYINIYNSIYIIYAKYEIS